MENKSLRIEAGIEPKVSPKFERVLKQLGNTTAKSLNTNELKKMNVEWNKAITFMEKFGKIDKGLTKQLKQESSKAWKEQTKLISQMNLEMNRSVKLYDLADKAARKWGTFQLRKLGISRPIEDLPANMRATWESRIADRAAGIRGQAGANIQSGMDFAQRLSADAEAAQAESRKELAMKIMRGGAWVQAGAALASGVGNAYFGFQAQQLEYGAQSRGFAAQLNAEINAGQFGSVFALARRGGVDQLRGIANNAKWQSYINQGTQFAGQAASAATGIAGMMAIPGSAAFTAGGTAQAISGGLGTATGFFAGKTQADITNQVLSSMNALKGMNPIEQQAFEGYMAQLPMLTTMANLGQDPAYIGRMLAAKGMTLPEGMPLFQQLRGAVGETHAGLLLPTAAGAEMNLGIGRGAAVQGLTGAAGMAQGATGADKRLEKLMASAMEQGIVESGLKEIIAAGMGDRGMAMGRLSSLASQQQMLALVAAQEKGFGRDVSAQSLMEGREGLRVADMMSAGRSPFGGLNVAQQRMSAEVARKARLSPATALALGALSFRDISDESDAFKDLIPDPKKRAEVKQAWLQGNNRVLRESFPGLSDVERNILISGPLSSSYAGTKLGTNLIGIAEAGELTPGTGPLRTPMSQPTAGLNVARIAGAKAQLENLLRVAENPDMQKMVPAVALMAEAMAKSFSVMSSDKLAQVGEILDSAAGGLNAITGAADNMLTMLERHGVHVASGGGRGGP